MEIETVPQLSGKIADMLGIYSPCSSKGKKCKIRSTTCCRPMFVIHMSNRIYEAVENERLIAQENKKTVQAI